MDPEQKDSACTPRHGKGPWFFHFRTNGTATPVETDAALRSDPVYPFATVAILPMGEVEDPMSLYAVGMAFLGTFDNRPHDNPCRKTGRDRAARRAMRAEEQPERPRRFQFACESSDLVRAVLERLERYARHAYHAPSAKGQAEAVIGKLLQTAGAADADSSRT